VAVGCDFLVCGFPGDQAAIFSISNPSIDKPSFVTHHGDLAFGVIGSGAFLAESALYAYGQSFIDNTASTVYQALAAKFSAETATDVGKMTHVAILRKGCRVPFEIKSIRTIRQIWDKNRPTVPQEGCDTINQAMQSTSQTSALVP
jgi:hypothetical protein